MEGESQLNSPSLSLRGIVIPPALRVSYGVPRRQKAEKEGNCEKDTRSSYAYRTHEIDEAFKNENWKFFERLLETMYWNIDTSIKRQWHKIDTTGWKTA